MNDFIVYPAIDLRKGKVVRLQQGKSDLQTVFSLDPLQVARQWVEQGAEWLHIVNLDGAFGETAIENIKALTKILGMLKGKVKIQVGGGFRSFSQIQSAITMGVDRVVLGTAVIENPNFGGDVIKSFGFKRVAIGIDALAGVLMTHGWVKSSGIQIVEFIRQLVEHGAKTFIYTNIEKDGMNSGLDWENAKKMKEEFPLDIIASGGTASLSDIIAVKNAGLDGMIIGRALYEGKFTYAEALNVC